MAGTKPLGGNPSRGQNGQYLATGSGDVTKEDLNKPLENNIKTNTGCKNGKNMDMVGLVVGQIYYGLHMYKRI